MDTSVIVFMVIAGMFCFFAAIVAVGGGVYWFMRNQNAAPQQTPLPPTPPAPRPRVAAPVPSPIAPPPPEPEFGDEEMPTVIVGQPSQIELPPGPSGAMPPPTPSRRTAGATIIAFDDEDDDE